MHLMSGRPRIPDILKPAVLQSFSLLIKNWSQASNFTSHLFSATSAITLFLCLKWLRCFRECIIQTWMVFSANWRTLLGTGTAALKHSHRAVKCTVCFPARPAGKMWNQFKRGMKWSSRSNPMPHHLAASHTNTHARNHTALHSTSGGS